MPNFRRSPIWFAVLSAFSFELCLGAVPVYTNYWAVHIEGGERIARSVVDKHGFTFLRQITADYYHIHHRKVAKRSVEKSVVDIGTLADDPQVKWLEQQVVKRRVKRGSYLTFNDPSWTHMWYMRESSQRKINLNVEGAWRLGYTGKGVVVTILDDGIESSHPDLQRNFEPQASFDINDNDKDPMPRYDVRNENKHGTRCAGQVAATANNNVCNVGVAYDARIGGIRMLDGDVTDSVEAMSLSYNKHVIDVYSASWGPDDDGKTVDGPAMMAQRAFVEGVTRGRKGLGSIFVWASGNGGHVRDSCNCDGYANSIYTLSISSTTENGDTPWYSEACSSTLATTYSSGSHNEKMIYTTDLRGTCTDEHTGTSASAPFAAGIVALALQANPTLTWRDMQYLVVLTSNSTGINANDWRRNGVGRMVSHHYGYGLMDAEAMVVLAANWTRVPKQRICEVVSVKKALRISPQGRIAMPIVTDGCEGDPRRHVRLLEHVQAKITISSQRRGDLKITLTSPSGTKSILLAPRDRDTSKMGFMDWPFMTTHCWGEPARGTWYLEIENGFRTAATLNSLTMILHGVSDNTPEQPSSPSEVDIDSSVWKCPNLMFLHQNQCVSSCPSGYYQNYDASLSHLTCSPCHWSCATCSDHYIHTCTSCPPTPVHTEETAHSFGSERAAAMETNKKDSRDTVPLQGRCTRVSTASSTERDDDSTLWWLTIGTGAGLCFLIGFLFVLFMYYWHTQGYLCHKSASSGRHHQHHGGGERVGVGAACGGGGSEEGDEDERAGMSHSSQAELVGSDEEEELSPLSLGQQLYEV